MDCWIEFGFSLGCLSISVVFFVLSFVARKSARKLRRKNLLTLDKFQLENYHLVDLKSRKTFMNKNRKNLSQTHPDYSNMKKYIDNHLSENDVYKKMEQCVFIVLKSRLTKKLSSCPIANSRMKELKTLMKDMKNHFSDINPYMVNQAVMFEFRERTMLNPFSLIGSRVFHLLVDTWTNETSSEDAKNCCSNVNEKLIKLLEVFHDSAGKCLACNSSYSKSTLGRMIHNLILATKTVLKPVGIWLADNVTDVLFFITYAQFVGDPILTTIHPTDQQVLPEMIYFLIVIGAVMSLSGFAFLASLFSCTSYIPRVLLRPFAVHHMMSDPCMVEAVDKTTYSDSVGQSWSWQPGDMATRYQFSLSEAGAESVGQFVGQWALFLSIGFITSHRQMEDIDMEYSLCYESLKNSTIASFLSLTLSQMKTNNLSHEFSIGQRQKILYGLASLLNTLAASILLICYTTYSFDLIVLTNYKLGPVFSMLLMLFTILSYFIVTYIANLWTRSDMLELGTINAMPGGLGKTSTSSTFIKPVIMFLNFTDNLFNSLRLPTSAYCVQTHYTTNHNQVNAKTLGMTARHYLTFSLYFLLIATTCSIHTILLKFDLTFEFVDKFPSTGSEARLILMILTMMVPFFMFSALLLCWFYLSGPQFQANLHFCWMKNTPNDAGVWEDLGPAVFTLLNFLGLTIN
eukprot:GFUD01007781.1.p1 GENE.GFUD01007781.1~~GFUD01007781.1.p1  ORF type:complete len:693 (+),score=115.26 GFUD01007781.1:27-2081(+)